MDPLLFTLIVGCTFASIALLAYLAGTSLVSGFSNYEEAYLDRTRGVLDEMSVFLPPERILTLKLISAFLGGLVLFTLGLKGPHAVRYVLGGVGLAAGLFVPDLVLHVLYNQRRKAINRQLPDAMNTMSNGLRSGLSFRQALELAARDLPKPAGQEFSLTYREVQLGVSLDDALSNMAKRLHDEDLQLMVNAVRLTMSTGGDLPVVFKQILETIRERNRIEGKIKSLTSQGRLQALIVGLVPVGLGLMVHFVNPDLMRLMYTTLPGWIMLAGAAILDIIGYYLIRRIISIKF